MIRAEADPTPSRSWSCFAGTATICSRRGSQWRSIASCRLSPSIASPISAQSCSALRSRRFGPRPTGAGWLDGPVDAGAPDLADGELGEEHARPSWSHTNRDRELRLGAVRARGLEIRAQRLLRVSPARAQPVETHARDDRRQPAAQVLDLVRVSARPSHTGILPGVTGLAR